MYFTLIPVTLAFTRWVLSEKTEPTKESQATDNLLTVFTIFAAVMDLATTFSDFLHSSPYLNHH